MEPVINPTPEQKQLLNLSSLVSTLSCLVDEEKIKPAPRVADFFLRIRSLKDGVEELSKQVNSLYQLMQYKIVPEVFERDGFTSFATDSGYSVHLSTTVRASIVGEKKPEAMDYLRKNEPDLITETVNASTLSSYARGLLEEAKELPSDLFKVETLTGASVKKKKNSSGHL